MARAARGISFWVFCFLLVPTSIGAQELTIPAIKDVPRIDRSSPRPPLTVLRNSAFALKLKSHPVAGNRYVILTDHQEEAYLASLERLAKHHQGVLLRFRT